MSFQRKMALYALLISLLEQSLPAEDGGNRNPHPVLVESTCAAVVLLASKPESTTSIENADFTVHTLSWKTFTVTAYVGPHPRLPDRLIGASDIAKTPGQLFGHNTEWQFQNVDGILTACAVLPSTYKLKEDGTPSGYLGFTVTVSSLTEAARNEAILLLGSGILQVGSSALDTHKSERPPTPEGR